MSMKTMVTVEKRKRPVRRKPAKTPPLSVSLPVGEGSSAEIRAILAEPGERREETPVRSGDCIEHEADAVGRATAVLGHGIPDGRGAKLDSSIRREMESRFGEDFSQVRVHTDPASEAAARELGARAYTVGQDVVFGAGEYAPATLLGRQLIAHELAHAGTTRSMPRSAGDPSP